MKCLLLLAISLVAVANAIPKSNCETSDDCDTGSCCVPMSRFFVVSKRALEKISVIDRFAGGRCVSYVKENDSCHMMGFAVCGCEPGTKCVYYPEKPLIAIPAEVQKIEIGKRMMINRPGKSVCEKPQNE